MKNFIYHNEIVHHELCYNLVILHNNLFNNQGSEIKTTFFVRFDILFFILRKLSSYSTLILSIYILYIIYIIYVHM